MIKLNKQFFVASGRKGGLIVSKKYGKKHFQEMQKKSTESQNAIRLAEVKEKKLSTFDS